MPLIPLDEASCRCGRPFAWDLADMDQWNAVVRAGALVGLRCPGCQTQAENLEAEVNAATTAYHLDEAGRVRGKPKGE